MRISVAKNHHFQNSLGLARLQTFVQNLTLTHSNITPGLYSLWPLEEMWPLRKQVQKFHIDYSKSFKKHYAVNTVYVMKQVTHIQFQLVTMN